MATKVTFKKTLESTIPATGTDGDIYYTDKGSVLVAGTNGTLVRMSDIKFVDTLPNTDRLINKFYLLKGGTINTWDGVEWHNWGTPSYLLPNATAIALGGIKIGDGLTADSSGIASTKLGTGLAFDANKNIIPDTTNIDITTLKNFSVITTGSPKGYFDSTATLSTFASGAKGDFWIYNGTSSFTLGGRTFATPGDQLWVKTTFTGTPTDLTTNHVYVANTLAQATTTTFGTVKLGSNSPVMNGTATVGTSLAMSREDHVHPSDTNKISKIASSTANAVVVFSDTTGSVLKDSTKLLPTGDILGTTDTQNISNKTMLDGTTYIANTTDTTKKVKFDTSGITTATTRTLTIPDRTGTIAISPSVATISTAGNITLQSNTLYEINNLAVKDSVLTLPSGTKTGDCIEFIVSCSGFSDSVTCIIAGVISNASNNVIVNRSYANFKFIWSASMSSWFLNTGGIGY